MLKLAKELCFKYRVMCHYVMYTVYVQKQRNKYLMSKSKEIKTKNELDTIFTKG